jgi:anti-sigma-K factor RskA
MHKPEHNHSKYIPDIKLEQFVLGELPANEAQQIEMRLQNDQILTARIQQIHTSNQELLQKYPFTQLLQKNPSIKNNATAKNTLAKAAGESIPNTENNIPMVKWDKYWRIAAALLVFLLPIGMLVLDTNQEYEHEYARSKGASDIAIVVYKASGDSALLLEPGELVKQGDKLQIKYLPKGKKYGFIFSVDGSGVLTRHLPLQGNMPAVLEEEPVVTLDYAYELDDAPLFERFYFVASDSVFMVNDITKAAARAFHDSTDSSADTIADDSADDSADNNAKLPIDDEKIQQFIFTLQK